MQCVRFGADDDAEASCGPKGTRCVGIARSYSKILELCTFEWKALGEAAQRGARFSVVFGWFSPNPNHRRVLGFETGASRRHANLGPRPRILDMSLPLGRDLASLTSSLATERSLNAWEELCNDFVWKMSLLTLTARTESVPTQSDLLPRCPSDLSVCRLQRVCFRRSKLAP